jgi:hypothetical protein
VARELPWFRIGGLGVLAAIAIAIVLIVRGGSPIPDHVQPIEWHKQPCAHCAMLVGEPAHAAQLITTDGDVLSFDDPGCALRYVDERRPRIHRLWFHHATADRWLTAETVAFTPGGTTPMASGLLAVETGTTGAIDLAAARTRLHAPAATLDGTTAPAHVHAQPEVSR